MSESNVCIAVQNNHTRRREARREFSDIILKAIVLHSFVPTKRDESSGVTKGKKQRLREFKSCIRFSHTGPNAACQFQPMSQKLLDTAPRQFQCGQGAGGGLFRFC